MHTAFTLADLPDFGEDHSDLPSDLINDKYLHFAPSSQIQIWNTKKVDKALPYTSLPILSESLPM